MTTKEMGESRNKRRKLQLDHNVAGRGFKFGPGIDSEVRSELEEAISNLYGFVSDGKGKILTYFVTDDVSSVDAQQAVTEGLRPVTPAFINKCINGEEDNDDEDATERVARANSTTAMQGISFVSGKTFKIVVLPDDILNVLLSFVSIIDFRSLALSSRTMHTWVRELNANRIPRVYQNASTLYQVCDRFEPASVVLPNLWQSKQRQFRLTAPGDYKVDVRYEYISYEDEKDANLKDVKFELQLTEADWADSGMEYPSDLKMTIKAHNYDVFKRRIDIVLLQSLIEDGNENDDVYFLLASFDVPSPSVDDGVTVNGKLRYLKLIHTIAETKLVLDTRFGLGSVSLAMDGRTVGIMTGAMPCEESYESYYEEEARLPRDEDDPFDFFNITILNIDTETGTSTYRRDIREPNLVDDDWDGEEAGCRFWLSPCGDLMVSQTWIRQNGGGALNLRETSCGTFLGSTQELDGEMRLDEFEFQHDGSFLAKQAGRSVEDTAKWLELRTTSQALPPCLQSKVAMVSKD